MNCKVHEIDDNKNLVKKEKYASELSWKERTVLKSNIYEEHALQISSGKLLSKNRRRSFKLLFLLCFNTRLSL